MKYIMFRVLHGTGVNIRTQKFPVIFPDFLTHLAVAASISAMHPGATPCSAGFITLTGMKPFGFSIGLNLDSNPEDLEILRTFDYAHGMKGPDI